MKNNTKISFFFGAGAEKNLKMPLGPAYQKETILEDNKELLEALRDFFNKNLKNSKFKHSANCVSINIKFLKELIKITLNKQNYEVYENEIISIFSKEEIKKIFGKEIDINENIETYDTNNILKELKAIINYSNYEEKNITYKIFNELFSFEKTNYSPKNKISYGLFLDNYFHTIIDPLKYGPNNFAKIINYYWRCYFCIVKYIVDLSNNSFQEYILNGKLNYKKILENFYVFNKKLNNLNLNKCIESCEKTNYYSCINKIFNDCEINGIITTNYYKYIEIIKETKHIYLSGKLNLFEFPEQLEVKDIENNDRNDFDGSKIFFPFIFGQSLIKPIVSPVQINEYTKFSQCLNNTEILIIIGYNINEDDNHINSFLRDFCLTGKQLIYVSDSPDALNSLRLDLKLYKNVIYYHIDYSTDVEYTLSKLKKNIFKNN